MTGDLLDPRADVAVLLRAWGRHGGELDACHGDCDAHRILCDGPGIGSPGGIRDVPRNLTGRPGERWCPTCLNVLNPRREEPQPS
ncbi:hypothetical protein [Streptomyces bobili]